MRKKHVLRGIQILLGNRLFPDILKIVHDKFSVLQALWYPVAVETFIEDDIVLFTKLRVIDLNLIHIFSFMLLETAVPTVRPTGVGHRYLKASSFLRLTSGTS